jgi:alpha-galactosidase
MRKLPWILFLQIGGSVALAPQGHSTNTVWLTSLELSRIRQGYGKPQINRSIRETPITIAGQKFERGLGTHAKSTLWIDLAGGSDRFLAAVGLDDAAGGPGSVIFRIFGDGSKLWESGVMKPGDPAKSVDLTLNGVKTLLLQVGDAGDGISYDHADWADARFIVSGTFPKALSGPREDAVILTPKPGPEPRINGPKVYGCVPGHPFLYRIPAQGTRPMRFAAHGLPTTLTLDHSTGVIAGTAPKRGDYLVTLHAKNAHGHAMRRLKIVAGDTLALTPPMGWNHWYTHYDRITDQLIRQAADLIVSSGMADVGYQYVNIDDCWMNAPKHNDPRRVGPLRDAQGNLLPNQYFPDMKALAEYIHGKGLKAGIYTSPGPLTCGGFAGAYQHEAQDAKQFADWGFDFLKYDWCSYSDIARNDPDPEWVKLRKPYKLMGNLLKQQPRDIVFNLCQYGMGNVWEWGAQVGGHCWRTAGDLGFELDRLFEVALKNAEHRAHSLPGSWNDPDYIQIGYVGDARGMGLPQPCPLTPNEQYAFMSLWSLMAAPLFYSGDVNRLDEFTLNILCNPEVIEVDQDPLGQCASTVNLTQDTFLMMKTLDDGSKALGLANRSEFETEVAANWSALGLKGKQIVRDLWRQTDLGNFDGRFVARVPRHGVVLVRLRPASARQGERR